MKHKMWSRLLSMVLAVMMITSIVPNSAFAEAASEIAASSQAVAEVVEQTEEVPLTEDTTTEEPAAETPAEEPAGEPASEPTAEPAPEPAPTEEPVAEPTETPVTETEQPTAEPTQAPAETAVPSAEPTQAPEATQTPEATAVPTETPAPSETPVPSETPAPSEEPAIDGQALLDELMAIEDDEAFMKAVNELTEEQAAALEALGEEALAEYALRVETLTAQEETVEMNAEPKEFTTEVEGAEGVTVTVNVPEGALPVDAELKAKLIEEETEEYKQAKAALEEQEADQDGMIVLDIRFELNGEEVEPAHPVQVKIVADNVLPEDADPATVAVQHLKENEDGTVTVENVAVAETVDEDTVQADMPAMMAAAPAEEQAGEAQPAEEPGTVTADGSELIAEFTVKSFSHFTVTWDEDHSLTIYYVSNNGGQIKKESENVSLESDSELNLKEYMVSVEEYSGKPSYGYLNYGPAESDNYTNQPKAVKIRCTAEGEWEYQSNSSSRWITWNLPQNVKERRVFLVYSVNRYDDAVPVDTENTEGKVIINLWDYENVTSRDSDDIKNAAINAGNSLLFLGSTSGASQGPNYYTNGHNVLQGIVENELDNGYPVLQKNSSWNDPYYRRWSPKENESLKYLFNPDAQAGQNGIEKVVKNANYLFQMDADGYYYYDSGKNHAQLDTKTGFFTVYNKQANNDNDAYFNPFVTDGIKSKFNPHFGMTVETSFVMPKDGTVNGQNMVFEFSGDDDVWVFVDDVLVLDMGGIHQDQSGSINFATGKVIVETENGGKIETSLEDCFKKAGKEWNDEAYYTHKLKFFYLERGAGYSNCKIKFNLQSIPNDEIRVGKKITMAMEEGFADAKFKMRVDIEGADKQLKPYSGPYKLYYMDGDKPVDGKEYYTENGEFVLQNGQYAVLNDDSILATTRYKVTELEAYNYSSDYKFNILESDIVDEEGTTTGVSGQSEIVQVGEYPYIIVQNEFTAEDKYNLIIQKVMEAGQTNPDEPFTVKITNSNGDAYTGQYYIRNIGDTTYPNNGQPASDGKISLSAGQEILLLGVTSGTTYVIKEDAPGEGYATPEYTANEVCDIHWPANGGISVTIKGSTGDKSNAVVTITNSRNKGDLVIEKNIVDNTSSLTIKEIQETLSFEVTDSTGKKIECDSMKWDSDTDLTGTITIKNLKPGTYTVTETSTLPGDKAVVTTKVQVGSNGATNAPDTEATVEAGKTTTVTFTNTYSDSEGYLKIYKTINGKELGGGKDVFSFKITDKDGKTWYMHVDGAGDAYYTADSLGTEKTTLELPAGDYTVTELDNINYTFTGVSAEKDETSLNDDDTKDHSITVKVGDGDITQVTFTNTPKPTNVPSDGSAVINGMKPGSTDGEYTLIFEQKKGLGQTIPKTTTSD